MESLQKIGVDVAKSVLDYSNAHPTAKTGFHGQILNQTSNITQWLSQYDPQDTAFVVEPTGTYSDKFFSIATDLGFTILLAHPRQSHYFTAVLGINNKTDKQAAQTLARMGEKLALPKYKPLSEMMKKRKQLLVIINGLEKDKQSISNRIHALKQYKIPFEQGLESLERIYQSLDQELELCYHQLQTIKDEEFEQSKTLLLSVIGIGAVNATYLLTITNQFQNFSSAKQVVKYLGLAPSTQKSGSSVRRNRGITKSGPSILRAKLFMAAKSAIRYNKACKALYTRLRKKGKPYYKAMVAVMAKLIRQCFGVFKSGTAFDNERSETVKEK